MKLTRLAASAGLLAVVGVTGLAVAGPAAAYPANRTATATINATVFTRGATVSVTVQNATPGGVLTMIFQSNPVQLATGTVVGTNRSATISGTIPTSAALGAHTITVNSTAGESFTFGITVVASGGGGGGTTTGNSGSGGGGGGDLANTGAAVTGIGVLGGILVAGGVLFVVAGRRRTANQTPSV